jgi:arylsulfatase B
MGNTEPAYDRENPILRGLNPVDESEYLTDALAREAVAFIDRHASKPFFLYLAYNVPHSPLQAMLEDMEKLGRIPDIHRRIFAAMVANLDNSFGRVLDALRRHKLDQNTLIIFFSDNGGPTRELTSSNAPLREGKGHVYEGGLRIPFLLQWSGRVPAGKLYDHPVISLDVVPTALAAAGAAARLPGNLDGVNLLPYLDGTSDGPPHETLFWRYGGRAALRSGSWKLVREPPRGRQTAPFELYNLSADIGEKTNLAASRPDLVKRLEAQWRRYDNQMVEPLWRSRGSGARKNWPLDLIE